MLVLMIPLGSVVGVHSHGGERREDIRVGFLILVAHRAVFAGLLSLLFVDVQDIGVGMMAEHMLDFPSISRGADHIKCPTGHLVQSTAGGEGSMITIVLDAGADEGGEYAHSYGPKGGNPKRFADVHVVEGEPKPHQKEDGLNPDFVSTSAGQIALLQSLHHAGAEGLVEIGMPRVEAGRKLSVLHLAHLELIEEGRGDATGVIRLEQDRGILPGRQEDDVAAGMAFGKVGDANYPAVDGSPCVLRDVVRSQFVAGNLTVPIGPVLKGCIAD